MDRPSSGIAPAGVTFGAAGAAASRVVADAKRGGPRSAGGDVERLASRPIVSAPEPRQRWRITFARDEIPSDRAGRSLLDEWYDALRASALPIAVQDSESNRPKLAFAAPLPAAARGEAELADLWLLERLPVWRLRESLENRLPPGHRWVSGEDIWLGAPPLPGQVSAAEWRIVIAPLAASAATVAEAARALLAAASLPRSREKGGASRTYDLRPLLGDLAVEPGGDTLIRVVTRLDPTLGTGRPEEIVAALAERAGITIEVRSMIRQRLILNEPVARLKPSSRSASARPPRR